MSWRGHGGSFLNVCIYRLPQGLSIAVPRSFCPACQTPIRAYDNIPIISFLILGGKCRKCRAPISWRYPLVEGLTGGLALAFFLKMGLTFSFFCHFSFAAALVVITFIDLDHRIIPDVISLPGIVIGFLLSLLGITLGMWNSLIGIAVGGGSLYLVAIVYEAVTKREGMGGGDVKLLAMIGAWLGWKAVLFTLFFRLANRKRDRGGDHDGQERRQQIGRPLRPVPGLFGPGLHFLRGKIDSLVPNLGRVLKTYSPQRAQRAQSQNLNP